VRVGFSTKAVVGGLGCAGKTTEGLGDGSLPAGSNGAVDGLGDDVSHFKVVTSKFSAFLVVISHIFTYICLCFFSVLAGMFSTKSAKCGGGGI